VNEWNIIGKIGLMHITGWNWTCSTQILYTPRLRWPLSLFADLWFSYFFFRWSRL